MKNETEKTVMRGELALLMVVVLNSLGVLLMLHSGSGISAISSVPYAFRKVMPWLTLGTWTYIFQGLLVCTLMLIVLIGKLLDKKFAFVSVLSPERP